MEEGSVLADTVGGLMSRLRRGDADAAGRLVDLMYSELRRMAAAKMAAERPRHTWQPTVLVHELYLELTRFKGREPLNASPSFNGKAAFLSLAAKLMERQLIDHARPLHRRMPKLGLEALDSVSAGQPGEETLQYIEGLLDGLAKIDPKFRTVVEGRVFLGMTLNEIAGQLGCSERTAATYWSFARRWLAEKLDEGSGQGGELR